MHRPTDANWDDLRFVLAVADTGTVSAAARLLGVNHATVLRRIAAFESAAGAAIFNRSATGYTVPPDRARVIDAAREAAQAMAAVAQSLQVVAPGDQPVRVTSTDTFCLAVLPVILALAPPDLPGVDLICANGHLDLGHSGADLTVRPALRLSADLAGDQAGVLGFAAYTARDGRDVWLKLGGVLGRTVAADWMQAQGGATAAGADSFLVLQELAGRGLGRAILPAVLGDADARLIRVRGLPPLPSVPIWIAGAANRPDSPRVAQVRQALMVGLQGQSVRLAG